LDEWFKASHGLLIVFVSVLGRVDTFKAGDVTKSSFYVYHEFEETSTDSFWSQPQEDEVE
jgi:hypothetical protein